MTNVHQPSENFDATVLVVGMHRSGTSAICRLLDDAGVDFGGNLIPPGEDNPLGFWEDRDFVALNERLMGSAEAWLQVTLPALSESEDWQREAEVFLESRYTKSVSDAAAIGLKDPRVCRTLSHWLPLIHKPRVLLAVRNPLSVAHSLNKRDSLSVEYGLALWFVYNFEVLKTLQGNNIDFCIVNYDRLMGENASESERVAKFLGLSGLNTSLLERQLQHQRFKSTEVYKDEFIKGLTSRLWGALSADGVDYKQFERAYESVCALYRPFYDLTCRFKELQDYEVHLENDIKSLRASLEHDVGLSQQNLKVANEQNDNLTVYIKHLETDLDKLREALQVERDEKNSLEVAANDQAEALNFVKAEHASLLSDYRKLEQVRWQVDELLQQVYHSKSWRWTAPLRQSRRKLIVGLRKAVRPARWLVSYGIRRFSSLKARAIISSRQNAAALQQLVDNRSLEKFWNPFPLMEGSEQPVIGLSVVLYNNGRWLKTFMESLINQSYPLDHIQLIFVDNSSTDDTLERLEEVQAQYHEQFASFQIERRPNKGFGCGHDHAIRLLNVDYVLVSNVDLEFHKDAIATVVATALSDKDIASWELRQAPYEHPKYVDPVTLHVNWSSHACVLLDRQAYVSVGGYEKRIFMYGEDVELSYRLRRAGYFLKYVPRAVVFHHTYESEGEIKPLQFSGSTAANLLIRCRYGNATDVLVGYFLIFALALRGAGFPGSRGMIWRSMPSTLAKSIAFLGSRRKSKAAFPFRGFDYDLSREGAFWESDQSFLERPGELPLVTVITRTVEGREALLNQAIMSVMNQTYPAVEHLIAEDGGDSAFAMCEQVKELSPWRYRIHHLECANKGRSHAANQALDEVAGEYVVILDDDDLLLPDHIETLMTEIMRHQCDAAYSLAWDTPVKYFDKSRGYYSENAHITLPLFYQDFDRKVLFQHNFLPIQSVLFKRSLAGDSIRFDEDLDHLEDWVFWKRLSKGADFRFVAKTTSIYKTPLSASENFKRKKMLDDAYATASKRPST